MLDVKLGRFGRVVCRMVMMAIRGVRMMCGEMMIPRFVVPRGFPVMMRGAFVMFGCTAVVFCCFFRHSSSSKRWNPSWAGVV
jgi:hypothetical protein